MLGEALKIVPEPSLVLYSTWGAALRCSSRRSGALRGVLLPCVRHM
jgi:hypothetical protein